MNCDMIKGNTKNGEFRALLHHMSFWDASPKLTVHSPLTASSLLTTPKCIAKHGGGVFCAISGDVLAPEETDLSKDNECV